MSAISLYFKAILSGVKSTRNGMALTWKHAWSARKSRKIQQVQDPNYFSAGENTGIFTLEYPHHKIPVPVNGRYQLHNEMDDCIVCDKCVKVCPVDCIEIEPIKATGLVGHTSDGSPIRLYAAKFDIDMSKCCFCGLCTTVCPTECLTMTSEYDFSVFDVKEHTFGFANLTKEQADEKRQLYEQFVAEKEALKASVSVSTESLVEKEGDEKPVVKPAFKPSFKPKMPIAKIEEAPFEIENQATEPEKPVAKPAFKPSFKPKMPTAKIEESAPSENENQLTEPEKPATKPAFKPSFKPKIPPKTQDDHE
jgi:NADH-quinone oxidoreductase subunit I